MKTVIPFDGFYESQHDTNLDGVIERDIDYIQDDLKKKIPDNFFEEVYRNINWSKVHDGYAKMYTEVFNNWLEEESRETLNIKYESLSSPREYNFTTDRIFADVPVSTVKKMFNETPRETLKEVIKEMFTSYDGFISHYSNDINDWYNKKIEDYDHNETYALLTAWLNEKGYNIDEDFLPWHVYEGFANNCNSELTDLIWNNMENKTKEKYSKLLEINTQL